MLEGVYQNLNYSSPADTTSQPSANSFQPFTSMKNETPSPPSALKHTETPAQDSQESHQLCHPQHHHHQQPHYPQTHYSNRNSYYRGYYQYPSTCESSEMYPRHHFGHGPLDPSAGGNVETTSPTAAAWPARPMGYSWNSSPARPLTGVKRGDETRLSMGVPRGPLSPPLTFGQTGRPKLTTTLWEDENTICYQVDAKGICVARRADTDMINGTKLLNVVGMSRGKRDGILKNEKGRLVIKVGAMHLKGVWIELRRAKFLATKFRIHDLLYPLLEDNPSQFIYSTNNPSASMLPSCSSRNDPSTALSSPPGSTVDSSSRRPSHTMPDSSSDTYSHHSWKEQQQRPPSLPIPSIESKLNSVKRDSAPAHYGSGYGAEPDASSILPTPQPSSNHASGYTGLNYYYRHYDYVHRTLQAPPPLASPDSDGKPATIEDSYHYRSDGHHNTDRKQHPIKHEEKHD